MLLGSFSYALSVHLGDGLGAFDHEVPAILFGDFLRVTYACFVCLYFCSDDSSGYVVTHAFGDLESMF